MARPLRARAEPGKEPGALRGLLAGGMCPQENRCLIRPLRLSTSGARRAASRRRPLAPAPRVPAATFGRRATAERGPSSRRSSLEPAKITVKGGACGAVTRDSLRSPLTVIMPGTIRRLSGGWPGLNDQHGGPV
jgi:hypothetical protein